MPNSLTRRQFVAAPAVGALGLRGRAAAPREADEPVAFFLVGDTHFFADKDDTAKLDPRSAAITARLVDIFNTLPGTEIPAAAGGGTVLAPRGVIHAGDCIDTGDKANVKMQETEWAAFADAYARIRDLVLTLLPRYQAQGKAYVTIAFGCTGGRHRSVFVAEQIAAALRESGFSPTLLHRNLGSRAADLVEGGQSR